jgi:hypothetical protein
VSPLGYHVILRLGDDRVIAPSRAERRRWARQLAALAEAFPVLAWKLADTHLHVLVLGDPDELVRRLRIWVTRALRPGVPLEVQRRKPLAGQSHLASAFAYVLRQDDHHGVEVDTYQDASAVLDVLGLRVLTPALPMRVHERLPRLTRDDLLRHVGVHALDEAVHVEHLAEAAAATFGLDCLGIGDASTSARRAAVHAAHELGPTAVAIALGTTPQTVCRLARGPAPPPRDLRAVRLQMALRATRAEAPAFVREAEAPPYGPLHVTA